MNELVLIESQAARTDCLTDVTPERAVEFLTKAKALIHFAQVDSGQLATTKQLADFYEVPEKTLRKMASRNKNELAEDGYRTITGKELKALLRIGSDSMSLPKNTTRLAVWTPRAALRLGLALTDSEVASQVRTEILDRALKPQPAAPVVPAIAPEEFTALQREVAEQSETIDRLIEAFNAAIGDRNKLVDEANQRFDALHERMTVIEDAAFGRTRLSPEAHRMLQTDQMSRQKINTAMDWYMHHNGKTPGKAWNELYREFADASGYYAPMRAEMFGCSNLDAVQRDGCLYDLYQFAWDKVFGRGSGLGQVR